MKKYGYEITLFVIFCLAWAWSGWHPADPTNWMLEFTLVLIFTPIIIIFSHYLRFSRLSLMLMTFYFVIHSVGAHYNYGSVPFGQTVGAFLGSPFNVYDRIVHFAFGFLFAFPIHEAFVRLSKMRGFWSYFMPIMIVLAASAIYEIMEWLSVLELDAAAGYRFIGGGDPFDGQKDMLLAGIGSFIFLLGAFLYHSATKKHRKD